MKQSEYPPPSSPTIDQQRDALQKGLGRAKQWAKAGKLEDEPLLAACLKDQRYDTQVEKHRGDWLWGIIQEVGAVDRFRVPILHALYKLDDERSASQLIGLAHDYAEAGDETFRARLYEIVESRPFPDKSWLAEGNIVDLDGSAGFLFAARIRGKELLGGDWEWEHSSLVDDAVERLGEPEVIRCLEETDDPDLIRFRETWRVEREKELVPFSSESYRDETRSVTVLDILSAAASDEKERFLLFRRWGRYADEADLESILEAILTTTRPGVIAKLLQVFFDRPLPKIDTRLFELCRHPDRLVRWRAFCALEKNSHPLVREFALAELGAIPFAWSVVGLFVKNYQKGDEARILEVLKLPNGDDFAIHALLMDVIKLLENNEDADCFPLALLTYASTPCENCRHRAVQLLLGEGVAPSWLIEECRFDSCPDIVKEISADGLAGSE